MSQADEQGKIKLQSAFETYAARRKPKITYKVIEQEEGLAQSTVSRLLRGDEQLYQRAARTNLIKILRCLARHNCISRDEADHFLKTAGYAKLKEGSIDDDTVLEELAKQASSSLPKSMNFDRYINPYEAKLYTAPVASTVSSVHWNIPTSNRNPFFIGREDIITRLHEMFHKAETTAVPQALCGLSGSGKTQTAIQYAFRYGKEYHFVFLVRANSRQTLIAEYVQLATRLGLPEQQIADQKLIVNAVKHWFMTHTGWLLILDNIDKLEEVKELIPSAYTGHILLTTQSRSTRGFAIDIRITMLSSEYGALFLLRRSGLIALHTNKEKAPQIEYDKAVKLSKMLDGLPLALDQAGAYMQQTGCSLSKYIERYLQQGFYLLGLRGGLGQDHPEPVATTWSLSFQVIEKENLAASKLLQLCAFLDPDNIPEEMIINGADKLDSILQTLCTFYEKWDAALELIGRFSLIYRDPLTNTLSMHRLVQKVLKETLAAQTQRQYQIQVIHLIEHAFPDITRSTWPLCQKYLAHARICAHLITQQTDSKRTSFTPSKQDAMFLSRMAEYLYQRGQYRQAEPQCRRALEIREQLLTNDHADIVSSVISLAKIYHAQGDFHDAKEQYLRANNMCERMYGAEDLQVASCEHNLAKLLYDEGKPTEAEPLCKHALEIRKQHLEPEHLERAQSLHLLGTLYRIQKKYYKKAEPLYQQALAIREHHLGRSHPDVAATLTDLAQIYQAEVKFSEAEQCLRSAYAIQKETLGREHPDSATTLSILAELYRAEGKYPVAEYVQRHALQIRKNILGKDHPDVARSLYFLARSLHEQHKYTDAEPLYEQALKIGEKRLGREHPDVAMWRSYYGAFLKKTGRVEAARKVALQAAQSETVYQQRNPKYRREPNIVLARNRWSNIIIICVTALLTFILDLSTKLLIIHFFPSLLIPVQDQGLQTLYATKDIVSTSLWVPIICVPWIILNWKAVMYARRFGPKFFAFAMGVGIGWGTRDYAVGGRDIRFIPVQLPNELHIALNIADGALFVSAFLVYLLLLFTLLERLTHRWRSASTLQKIQREIES